MKEEKKKKILKGVANGCMVLSVAMIASGIGMTIYAEFDGIENVHDWEYYRNRALTEYREERLEDLEERLSKGEISESEFHSEVKSLALKNDYIITWEISQSTEDTPSKLYYDKSQQYREALKSDGTLLEVGIPLFITGGFSALVACDLDRKLNHKEKKIRAKNEIGQIGEPENNEKLEENVQIDNNESADQVSEIENKGIGQEKEQGRELN